MEDIRRILVMSRSTKSCHKAIHYGFKLSKMIGAELYVTHVFTDIFNLEGGNIVISQDEIREEYKQAKSKTKAELDKLIAAEQDPEKPVEVKEIIANGPAYDEVIDLIKKNRIDLLIMMAHEEGHLESYLFDHDNQRLIRSLPCSIFLVKE